MRYRLISGCGRLLHQLIEQHLQIGGGMRLELGAERLRRDPEAAEDELRHGVVALLGKSAQREVDATASLASAATLDGP